MAASFYQPPLYCPGEMVEEGSESDEGVSSLQAEDMITSPLPLGHPSSVTLQWEEEPAQAVAGKRSRPLGLCLVVENGHSQYPASLAASLPGGCQAVSVRTLAPLPSATLQRTLPRDVTASLPASLGPAVTYSTLSAAIPPRTRCQVCLCQAPDADSLPGFVYLLAAGPPHAAPGLWTGLTLGFPLGGPGPYLCTQGFGGRGHHRGPSSHHAADLACPEGTPVLAMADGTVTHTRTDAVLSGAHVDLLPECNVVKLRCGAHTITYLHLAPGSITVAVGQAVAKGSVLGRSGSTGFSLGPHLHVQCNELLREPLAEGEEGEGVVEEGPSVMWGFEPVQAEQPAIIPTAGYYYTPAGTLAPNLPALTLLRQRIGLLPASEGSSSSTAAPSLHALAQAAMLWLHPQSFIPPAEDALPVAEQSQATAERCFPSLHTCLVANVLAPVALLVDGLQQSSSSSSASSSAPTPRFTGAFPPLYLSCTLNFDRDDASGELFSCEVALREHQEGAASELATVPAVRQVLDPRHLQDWQGFFRAKYAMTQAWEVWKGEEFQGNSSVQPGRRKGYAAYPVYSLARSTLGGLEGDERACCGGGPAQGASAGGGGGGGGGGGVRGGGCVLVFRQGPAEAEPFGVWLCWLLAGAELVFVDLQNGAVSGSLLEAVALLKWQEAPQEAVFYAPFRGQLGTV